jgi:hypothetical protein
MANAHKGVKLPMPSRTYNLTVNHRRQILSTTRGHPSRWNDKTLVLFDAFAKGIYDGTVLSDVEFSMLEHDENREIVTVRYKGVENNDVPYQYRLGVVCRDLYVSHNSLAGDNAKLLSSDSDIRIDNAGERNIWFVFITP